MKKVYKKKMKKAVLGEHCHSAVLTSVICSKNRQKRSILFNGYYLISGIGNSLCKISVAYVI